MDKAETLFNLALNYRGAMPGFEAKAAFEAIEAFIRDNYTEVQQVPEIRFCIQCLHHRSGTCAAPDLPKNLVDGTNTFPVFVARGFDGLCGPVARYWEPNE